MAIVRLSACALLVALGSLAFGTSTAHAGGYFTSGKRTFYSDFLHYRLAYNVYDSRGYCEKDEYGFYNDFDCDDYDSGDASVDMVVYRMRGKKRPRIVLKDRLLGFGGRVTQDLYTWELDGPDCPHPKLYYRILFRLRDPITDRVVDTRTSRFTVTCSS